jgi:aspartyl-tRNA synthetase
MAAHKIRLKKGAALTKLKNKHEKSLVKCTKDLDKVLKDIAKSSGDSDYLDRYIDDLCDIKDEIYEIKNQFLLPIKEMYIWVEDDRLHQISKYAIDKSSIEWPIAVLDKDDIEKAKLNVGIRVGQYTLVVNGQNFTCGCINFNRATAHRIFRFLGNKLGYEIEE